MVNSGTEKMPTDKRKAIMAKRRHETLDETMVDESVNWLKDNAEKMAQNRANRLYLEQYSKSLKALLMKKFSEMPISAQEREAYAHTDYQEHIKAYRTAVFLDEKYRFLKVHHEARIEAWRTQQANIRAIKI